MQEIKRTTATNRQPLITADELGTWLGVSKRHIERLVQNRVLPVQKVGKLNRFNPADIEQWLEQNNRAARNGR